MWYCSKSAAIRGTPAVALTHSGRRVGRMRNRLRLHRGIDDHPFHRLIGVAVQTLFHLAHDLLPKRHRVDTLFSHFYPPTSNVSISSRSMPRSSRGNSNMV